jgi:hypothetical protein
MATERHSDVGFMTVDKVEAVMALQSCNNWHKLVSLARQLTVNYL